MQQFEEMLHEGACTLAVFAIKIHKEKWEMFVANGPVIVKNIST